MLKGTIYHLIARSFFLLSSYALHIGMAYYLSDPSSYGTFGVIMSIITLFYTFLSTGLPQAVSRFISQNEIYADYIMKKAIRLQMIFILFILIIYLGAIPFWILFLKDKTLTGYLLISALLIPLMSCFQMYLSYFNGKKQFGLQAVLILLYSLGRFLFAFGLVLLGMKIFGILIGFILSTLIPLALAKYLIKQQEVNIPFNFDSSLLIRFASPIVLFSLGNTLLLNLDLFLLKHFFPQSPIIGYYTGSMAIGKAPFFIFSAFSVTILPMVSRALKDQDLKEAKTLIRKNLSALLFLSIPSATIVFATSDKLLRFVYPSGYEEASPSLGILIFSMSALVVLHSLFHTIIAYGKPILPTLIISLCILLQIGLSLLLIPEYQMKGAVYSSLISISCSLLVTSFLVFKYFGTFFNKDQLLRIILCSVILYILLSKYNEFSIPMLPLVYGLAFLIFCLLMFMIGRIRRGIRTVWK